MCVGGSLLRSIILPRCSVKAAGDADPAVQKWAAMGVSLGADQGGPVKVFDSLVIVPAGSVAQASVA